MKIWLFTLLALVVSPFVVSAQSPTSYTLTIYAAGTTTVIGTPTVMAASAFVCNQATVVGTGTVNPNVIEFADPDPTHVNMACVYSDPGTGPLSVLPFGAASYEATAIATNSLGSSVESARALPFTRPGLLPAVLTFLKIIHR